MSDRRSTPSKAGGRAQPGRPFALVLWYGAMIAAGLGFGAVGDRRPFGEGILFHPLILFFILVGVALLALRIVLARPVPEIISDRALLFGCAVGLVSFLIGNFARAHFFVPP